MDRKARIAVLGIFFAVLLSASVFIVSTYLTSAQNWQDYLTLEYNTDYCLSQCEAIFTVKNPTPSAVSLASDDVKIWPEVAKGQGLVGDIEIYKEEEVSYEEDVPDYGVCSYIENGTTIDYACQIGSHKETKTRKEFVPFSFSGKTLNKDDVWRIKIVGHKKPSLGENNIEWLIDFNGMKPPWAWWLSNYSYRRNNSMITNNSGNVKKIPVPINGSLGFSYGSSNEYVWCLLDDLPSSKINGSLLFYYNNFTNYECVNASDNSSFLLDVEFGNRTNLDIAKRNSLWQGSYHNLVWHMNSTKDSTGLHSDATTSGITYSNTTIFGKSINLTGTSSKFHMPDDINEGTAYTIEFWVYDTSPAAEVIFSIWGGGYNKNLIIETDGAGNIDFRELTGGCGLTAWGGKFPPITIPSKSWQYIAVTRSAGGDNIAEKVYWNGTLVATYSDTDNCNVVSDGWGFGRPVDDASATNIIDEFRFINKSLSAEEINARYWLLAKVDGSILGSEEQNSTYSPPADELQGDDAILQGILNSTINSTVTSYPSQQVYMVNVTGQQKLGRFDYVAVYGNQRWAFNYVSTNESTSSYTYMVNITPSLYVWENTNLTYSDIRQQVTAIINSTKM